MRKNVCLKSTLRQPARTLVLVLLIGLISFAFVSKVAEYLVVNRETDRLAGYYRSIGTLHKLAAEDGDWDVQQGVRVVSESQYVAFEDLRRHCSGVLQGIYNSDLDGGHWVVDVLTWDVVFYGKLLSKAHLPGAIEEYQFRFEVDDVVAGFPEYVREGREINLKYFPKYVRDPAVFPSGLKYVPGNPDEMEAPYRSLEVGTRYLVRARFDPYYLAFYVNERGKSAGDFLTIRPLQSGVWFQEVEPGARVDLADPAWAELAGDLAIMEENQHTMRVISTQDMSSMPETQEASKYLYLVKGRWLDRNDHLEGRRVCVVHNDFAVRRGLSVGDTITLKLRDLKNGSLFGWYIIAAEDRDAWQSYETHTEEFQIVGLYGRLSSPGDVQPTFWSSFVYIPDSCMPAGYDSRERIWEGDYSFVLDSPEHEDDFLAETQKVLKDLGIEVRFVETGWNNFQATAVPLKQSLAINVRVFSAVLVVAMALAAFLYLWQRRRDFAIMRSMGVPKYQAIRQLVWSMVAIGTTAVAAGGIVSWRYALGKAAGTLAVLQGPKGQGPSADLSPVWLGVLCILAVVVLLSFTTAGAWVMSRRPVLELLQGAESRAVRKRRLAAREEGGGVTEKALRVSSGAVQVVPEGGMARPAREVRARRTSGRTLPSKYVLRYILRAPLKSFLTVSVALGFTVALGWLNWSIEQNNARLDELYRATQVEVEIVRVNPSLSMETGFIPSGKVDAVLNTGFVKDAYLVAKSSAGMVGAFVNGKEPERDYKRSVSKVPLLGFSRPECFFSEMGRNVKVEYAEGCDQSVFSKDWTGQSGGKFPVVLPRAMMSKIGLRLGDSVWIQHKSAFSSIDCRVVGQYAGTFGLGDTPILLPLSALKALETSFLRYSVARFAIDPEKNRELPEFRAQMSAVFGEPGKSDDAGVALLFWDNQLTQVVEPMEKNLVLIRILRSVTITTSALIAAGLGALMVFQKAKEAAIMRVLGVTKRVARFMLCGEQGLLCLLGVALGLGSFAALRGQVRAVFTFPALGCAGLYVVSCLVGAWLGARSVTDRPPLDLLQVKE